MNKYQLNLYFRKNKQTNVGHSCNTNPEEANSKNKYRNAHSVQI